MFYQEDLIEEVRSRSDIVSIIGSYVRLQRRGNEHMGLCPFHSEKTPSFHVSDSKQMYYCFGCGAGGNVFTFLMEYENLSFAEAVKELADRSGIPLPEAEYSEEMRKAASQRSQLLEIYKKAAGFYYWQLTSPQGQRARDYFAQRQLTEETVKHFGLGYAGKYSDQLYRYLKEKGYADTILKESGLFLFDERKGAMDRFWDRAMFPILDVNSRVIAFGGRHMGEAVEKVAKYLNSPETKLFDKSRNLYGINIVRQSRKGRVLLCEGYMDVISLHQAGFDYALASLGTAFTPLQAGMLKRYAKDSEVILTYDSDGAGIKAAMRAIPLLREAGFPVKVLNMKPYKDPDEFIKALGPEEYEKRIKEAVNFFFFEIDVIEKDYDLEDPQRKNSFFDEVARKLTVFTDELERHSYAEAAARRYQIRLEDLWKRTNRIGAKQAVIQISSEAADRDKKERISRKEISGALQSQKLLLTWMADDGKLFDKLSNLILPEDFAEGPLRETAVLMYGQYQNEHSLSPARIINHFEECEEQKEVAALFNTVLREGMSEKEREKAIEESVIRVKRYSLEEQGKKAIERNDTEGLQRIIKEKAKLQDLHIF